MLLIAGTVPVKDFPLTIGPVTLDGDFLVIENQKFPCGQGTGAMLSAAVETLDHLGLDPPHAVLAGDIGDGGGSRLIYDYLIREGAGLGVSVLALHYLQPVMGLMKKLVGSVGKWKKKPVLIADAGSMYAAKAAGLAPEFEVFTPDAAEAAFLGDPDATHPAYIRKSFFEGECVDIEAAVAGACGNKNAARLLLVKGSVDRVVENGRVLHTVDEPDVPEMESIGGTGDTITGMVAAFVFAGLEPHEAAVMACRANRTAGKYAGAKPDTRISEIIHQFKPVFRDHLCAWSGICTIPKGEGDD